MLFNFQFLVSYTARSPRLEDQQGGFEDESDHPAWAKQAGEAGPGRHFGVESGRDEGFVRRRQEQSIG